jgi:hypothetical protein
VLIFNKAPTFASIKDYGSPATTLMHWRISVAWTTLVRKTKRGKTIKKAYFLK